MKIGQLGARLLIIADVWTANLYIISYAVTVPRVIAVGLIARWLVGRRHRVLGSTKLVVTAAVAMVLFKLFVDLTFHVQSPLDPIRLALAEMAVIMMLPVMEELRANEDLVVRTYAVAGMLAGVMAFAQVFDGSLTVQRLLGGNPFLLVEQQRFDDYLSVTQRVTGPFSNAIGMALLAGSLLIVAVSLLVSRQSLSFSARVVCLIGSGFLFVTLILTQTRSGIYGVWPSLLIAYFLAIRKKIRATLVLVAGAGVLAVGFGAYQSFVQTYSERSAVELDANTYYKITANVYGVYGALSANPLIGVPVNRRLDREGGDEEDWKLVEKGYRALGGFLDAEQEFRLAPTNHNIFAFYLKYYGLCGFVLFVVLLFSIYRKIQTKDDDATRLLLMGVFVFHLQYALLHNTQITQTLMIWILLAIGTETGGEGSRMQRQKRAPIRMRHSILSN